MNEGCVVLSQFLAQLSARRNILDDGKDERNIAQANENHRKFSRANDAIFRVVLA